MHLFSLIVVGILFFAHFLLLLQSTLWPYPLVLELKFKFIYKMSRETFALVVVQC